MTIAELHHKQGEEDSLTSDVFGAFKYLPSSLGLLPFLGTAKPFEQGAQVPSWVAESAVYCFWPRAKRREPDLFILLTRGGKSPIAIVVEAKYHSPKHNLEGIAEEELRPTNEPEATIGSEDQNVARTDGDQLADYFCSLLEGAIRLDQWRKYEAEDHPAKEFRRLTRPDDLLKGVSGDDKYLLYVTAHYALPSTDIDETLASLSKRGIPKKCHGQLLWTNWQNAASTLKVILKEPSVTLPQPQFELALDTLSLLNEKRLVPFCGWNSLILDQIAGLEPPYFWRYRFFTGISSLGLALGESTYFFSSKSNGGS